MSEDQPAMQPPDAIKLINIMETTAQEAVNELGTWLDSFIEKRMKGITDPNEEMAIHHGVCTAAASFTGAGRAATMVAFEGMPGPDYDYDNDVIVRALKTAMIKSLGEMATMQKVVAAETETP